MRMRKKFLPMVAILAALIASCTSSSDSSYDPYYRQEMREFVQGISNYAEVRHAGFIVIPQNGQEILTENGEADGSAASEYIEAIDGIGREDLFYGYGNDDEATPSGDLNYMLGFTSRAKVEGIEVLTTDYCWSSDKVNSSYSQNSIRGYISYAAPDRELNIIPSDLPCGVNSNDISDLSQAKNFLYLLNPDGYTSAAEFVSALAATDYDVLIIDAFYNGTLLSSTDVASLSSKNNGGNRLVISYMSIGEAEDYRYYWQSSWNTSPPEWLAGENPDWPGNYKVKYWDFAWQDVIFGSTDAYLDKILASGFDGVYLDIIDAFEYFE